ncbi:hypothetical protein GY15_23790 [Delftia sp. 670]|nr:hypothetical protein GY15_23790 [Delftia sp. 670]
MKPPGYQSPGFTFTRVEDSQLIFTAELESWLNRSDLLQPPDALTLQKKLPTLVEPLANEDLKSLLDCEDFIAIENAPALPLLSAARQSAPVVSMWKSGCQRRMPEPSGTLVQPAGALFEAGSPDGICIMSMARCRSLGMLARSSSIFILTAWL